MEEIKSIEMNDEALEVAEGFVENQGGTSFGKVAGGILLTVAGGVALYYVVKGIKKKIAAKKVPQITEPIEVEHTEVEDAESEEN